MSGFDHRPSVFAGDKSRIGQATTYGFYIVGANILSAGIYKKRWEKFVHSFKADDRRLAFKAFNAAKVNSSNKTRNSATPKILAMHCFRRSDIILVDAVTFLMKLFTPTVGKQWQKVIAGGFGNLFFLAGCSFSLAKTILSITNLSSVTALIGTRGSAFFAAADGAFVRVTSGRIRATGLPAHVEIIEKNEGSDMG